MHWGVSMPQNTHEFTTRSEEESLSLAERMGASLKGSEVVLLEGELGAGKTVFTRGLAAGLGLEDLSLVCSPSFTLVNVYPARVPIFHMDLYRLLDPGELDDLGWEDFLGQGVIVVEWGERLGYEDEAFRVLIRVEESGARRISIITPFPLLF